MSDILKQIDQLVADKTFSLDALDGIKAIRDALIEAEVNNKNLLEENAAHIKELSKVYSQLEEAAAKASDLIAENVMMKSTVAAGQEAIYTAQRHEAVANAWKEAMQTVFKPNTVRETVNRTMPIAVSGSNGGPGYVSSYGETSNVVREEG